MEKKKLVVNGIGTRVDKLFPKEEETDEEMARNQHKEYFES